MRRKEGKNRRPLILLAAAAGLALLGLAAAAGAGAGPYTVARVADWVRATTDPLLFFGLMAVLPVVGAPISIFLVIAGIRYGFVEGLAISAGSILIHLIATYLLVGSVLRPFLVRLLESRGHAPPRLPRQHPIASAFVFMALPLLPYAVKNYMFALSGVGFRTYLAVGLPVQVLWAIPFCGLGFSMGWLSFENALLISAVIILLLLLFKRLSRQHRRRRRQQGTDDSGRPENGGSAG